MISPSSVADDERLAGHHVGRENGGKRAPLDHVPDPSEFAVYSLLGYDVPYEVLFVGTDR
jgi:hypothetical protein